MLSSLPFCARAFWPRKIIDRFRPLLEPSGPAPEHLCHPVRRDPELRHRHAAVDGFAVFGDQAVAHDEAADAVDHHMLACELRDLGGKTRERPGIAAVAVE